MTDAASSHPHDLDQARYDEALSMSPHPDLLRALVATARSNFGFFTGHFPHTINYPWVCARLSALAPGARVLDVGAGVTPVPLWLADRGMAVTTVDNNPLVRMLPVDAEWNEWGFFDYAALDARIASQHRSVLEHVPEAEYDAIYSISVLAHMPRAVREECLAATAGWLRPGGILVLAVDLIPPSDFLWNRSEGRLVEPPFVHGTWRDVLAGMEAAGLDVVEHVVHRSVPDSRTDLLFVHARKPGLGEKT